MTDRPRGCAAPGAPWAIRGLRIVRQAERLGTCQRRPRYSPTKRALRVYPEYHKTSDDPVTIVDAGLDTVRCHCPHVDNWLREVETRPRVG